MQVYKEIIRVLESHGTTAINITRIQKELGESGTKITSVRLSGYLDALSDLDMIAFIPALPAKGYMSITGFWRLYGEKYSKSKHLFKLTGE